MAIKAPLPLASFVNGKLEFNLNVSFCAIHLIPVDTLGLLGALGALGALDLLGLDDESTPFFKPFAR
ncbi:hypothetical protein ACVQ8P_03705 [Dellaglioa sp. BT-FLS60]